MHNQNKSGKTKSTAAVNLKMEGTNVARKPKVLPDYTTCVQHGYTYYRSRIVNADGKRVSIQAKTKEELYIKIQKAEQQISEDIFRRENPTVQEYAEKWLKLESGHLRNTTLSDYTYKVKTFVIKPLGHMYLCDVTPDDVKEALLNVRDKSRSVYHSVYTIYKSIFASALESDLITKSPCENVSWKGGIEPKVRQPLTDEQVNILLSSIKGLPPYPFVMLGLYAGLRREEILALQWDCVFLDVETPYISVQRAWHVEHNRPIILNDLKTKAARRNIPIPPQLTQCLKEVKETSASDYVIANSDGNPLSYTQFQRVWKYIVTRSTKERTYTRYVNGQRIVKTVKPILGEKAAHNGKVVYTMDFQVTPHQLRHTYITNLIFSNVDPKTVQYLAGHENSKMTMDIYAKVKYNKPKELAAVISKAFSTEG